MLSLKQFRKFDSDINVVEFSPDKFPSQLVFGDKDKLEPLSSIHHPWFDANGYYEVAKINAGFNLSSNKGVSEHLGWSLTDHGISKGSPNVGVECYLDKNNKLIIKQLDSSKDSSTAKKWGGSFSYSLLINGQKIFLSREHFSHFDEIHPRTLLAQKSNGNILWITIDGRKMDSKIEYGLNSRGVTGEESYLLLEELECSDGVNLDGGGSTQINANTEDGMKVLNNPSDGHERSIGSSFILYSKKKEVFKIATPTKKKKLALDAGHGINTYKETGSKGVPAMEEFSFNSKVVGYAKMLAEYNGFEVILTQPLDGRDQALINRTNKANRENADLLFSYHADANNSPDVNGHWAFYWHSSKNSKRLAEIWDKYANQIMNNNCRGIKPSIPKTWTNFHMVRETNMPALLPEHEFMTSPTGIKNLLSDDFRRKCAETSIQAACEYFGMSFSLPSGYYDSAPTSPTNSDIYTIKSGDTLWSVATSHGLTVNEIKEINNLISNVVLSGQKLKVKKDAVENPTKASPTPEPVKEDWEVILGKESINFLNNKGLVNSPEDYYDSLKDNTPQWLTFTLIKRLYEKLES